MKALLFRAPREKLLHSFATVIGPNSKKWPIQGTSSGAEGGMAHAEWSTRENDSTAWVRKRGAL